jgi:hypothetical protein
LRGLPFLRDAKILLNNGSTLNDHHIFILT